MAMLEELGIFLGIWLLFLLLAFSSLWLSPEGGLGRRREAVSEQRCAQSRAHVLVEELLTEKQYQQLITCGYLEVASPTRDRRLYRIPGAGGLVKVYEGGSAVMDWCVQPADPLPDAEVVLLQKLMIEGNEAESLQQAKQFAPGILLVNRATVRRLLRRMVNSLKGGQMLNGRMGR